MKTKAVKLSEIVIDEGTQQREKTDHSAVDEFAEALRCGAKFPAVTLFFDGAQNFLADGFHRYWAHKAVEGMLDILADVHEGTQRDALWYSAGANNAHGIRPSIGDKRKSILVLLLDAEWAKLTDTAIASHCHATGAYVGQLRGKIDGKKTGSKKVNCLHADPEANNDAVVVTESPKKEAVAVDEMGDDSINPETGLHESDAEYSERQKLGLLNTIDAQHAQITALVERQAASVMDIPKSEQVDLVETIDGLRKEVKVLSASLEAVSAMRDRYMAECAQLKKQCSMLAKKASISMWMILR